eukprot:c1348_g1_i1.p1 GENE.c1348_g1_i1~~c1348_g1_i1.p1  ORF type:complete len:494 (+),score=110.22 c1348_g1_i1:56-1483(+)
MEVLRFVICTILVTVAVGDCSNHDAAISVFGALSGKPVRSCADVTRLGLCRNPYLASVAQLFCPVSCHVQDDDIGLENALGASSCAQVQDLCSSDTLGDTIREFCACSCNSYWIDELIIALQGPPPPPPQSESPTPSLQPSSSPEPSLSPPSPGETNLVAFGSSGFCSLGPYMGVSAEMVRVPDENGVLRGRRIVYVATGNTESVLVLDDGTVAVAGDFNGTVQYSYSIVPGLSNVVSAFASHVGVGVLTADGKVYTWGAMPASGTPGVTSATPLLVEGELADKVVTMIALTQNQGLALADGKLYLWNFQQYPTFFEQDGVLKGKTIAQISASDGYFVVLTSEGEVIAWSTFGFLDQTPFVIDTDGKRITKIAGSLAEILMLAENGRLYSWATEGPATQLGIPDDVQIVAMKGGAYFSLAVTASGAVYGWGNSQFGALGVLEYYVSSPILIQGLRANPDLFGMGFAPCSLFVEWN